VGRRLWLDWRATILFVVFVVVPVKSSLADWNWVPTGSMNPTILDGDLIYVNKIAYDLRIPLTMHRLAHWAEPEHGDIVVCLSPEDGVRLVKRVVGKPGDTVEMRRNTLFLNGRPLDYSRTDQDYAETVPRKYAKESRFAIEQLDAAWSPARRSSAGPARSWSPSTSQSTTSPESPASSPACNSLPLWPDVIP